MFDDLAEQIADSGSAFRKRRRRREASAGKSGISMATLVSVSRSAATVYARGTQWQTTSLAD